MWPMHWSRRLCQSRRWGGRKLALCRPYLRDDVQTWLVVAAAMLRTDSRHCHSGVGLGHGSGGNLYLRAATQQAPPHAYVSGCPGLLVRQRLSRCPVMLSLSSGCGLPDEPVACLVGLHAVFGIRVRTLDKTHVAPAGIDKVPVRLDHQLPLGQGLEWLRRPAFAREQLGSPGGGPYSDKGLHR